VKIIIEKNVELPNSGRKGVYPFYEMMVGDSFAAPRDMGDTVGGQDKRQNTIASCARLYCKKYNLTAKFTVRLVDDNTVRCWRTA